MGNYYLMENYSGRAKALSTVAGAIGAMVLLMGLMTGALYSAPGSPGDTAADKVFGQPNFTSNTVNNGGVSASSFSRKQIVKIHRDFH